MSAEERKKERKKGQNGTKKREHSQCAVHGITASGMPQAEVAGTGIIKSKPQRWVKQNSCKHSHFVTAFSNSDPHDMTDPATENPAVGMQQP